MKAEKTNAARLLDKAGISYSLIPYPVDEEHLDAIHVAESLGEDLNRVYKTIVLRGDRTGLFVCVVPGGAEVNLKLAAKASGNKSAAPLHLKELLPSTGYIRGGCSPIGMKKPYPTYFDQSCVDFDYIFISAGMRGLQLKIKPVEIIQFLNASAAELC